MDNPVTFMLESLRELQTTLLLLMERAARAHVAEADNLEWTLTDVLTAYRALRAGQITWIEAARVYQTASNVQLECDMAVMDAEMAGNYDWWMVKRLTEAPDEASS